MEEIWKEVPGYDGVFASSLGRIRGPKSIRATYLENGYPTLHLRPLGGSKKHRRAVHRLVLEAFSGPRPKGMECRHLNGIRHDNRLCNIVWGTHDENTEDNHRNRAYRYGQMAPKSKLNPEQVKEIFFATGSHRSLGRKYGVSGCAIRRIKIGRNWGHITASL